jgi:predicted  nucleic acid-binding Zn-ribbon protein
MIQTELKSEKVELALVDDLEKLNNSYLSDTDTANSKIKGLLSDARSIESKIESALKNVSKIKSAISKVEQSAKDLGIKTSNIKELETANTILKDSNDYKQILSSLKKLITTI